VLCIVILQSVKLRTLPSIVGLNGLQCQPVLLAVHLSIFTCALDIAGIALTGCNETKSSTEKEG
jgi:hypothetical protein